MNIYDKAQEIRDIIKSKIPDNSIVAEHTENSHHYRVHLFDGSPLLDSVTSKTSILSKSYLQDWGIGLAINYIKQNMSSLTEDVFVKAANTAKEVLDVAGHIGTIVHGLIENYIDQWIALGHKPTHDIVSTVPDGSDTRVLSCIYAVQAFFNEHDIVPIHSELLVASKVLDTAGTMDFLCFVNVDGKYKLGLLDWKTSNSVDGKAEYALQTAAYATATTELTGLEPELIWVIRLDKKTGKYEKAVLEDIEEAKQAYIHIAELYRYVNNGKNKLPTVKKEKNILQL